MEYSSLVLAATRTLAIQTLVHLVRAPAVRVGSLGVIAMTGQMPPLLTQRILPTHLKAQVGGQAFGQVPPSGDLELVFSAIVGSRPVKHRRDQYLTTGSGDAHIRGVRTLVMIEGKVLQISGR